MPKTKNRVEAGEKKELFCSVCGSPGANSMTVVGKELMRSCSDECAEMLQRRRQILAKK